MICLVGCHSNFDALSTNQNLKITSQASQPNNDFQLPLLTCPTETMPGSTRLCLAGDLIYCAHNDSHDDSASFHATGEYVQLTPRESRACPHHPKSSRLNNCNHWSEMPQHCKEDNFDFVLRATLRCNDDDRDACTEVAKRCLRC